MLRLKLFRCYYNYVQSKTILLIPSLSNQATRATSYQGKSALPELGARLRVRRGEGPSNQGSYQGSKGRLKAAKRGKGRVVDKGSKVLRLTFPGSKPRRKGARTAPLTGSKK